MKSLDLTHIYQHAVSPLLERSHATPLPGRIILEIEPKLDRIGNIHVPDSARDQITSDTHLFAKVLAIGYGPYYDDKKLHGGLLPEDVAVGDRVVFRALMQDLNCKVILTGVSRVDAVVEG